MDHQWSISFLRMRAVYGVRVRVDVDGPATGVGPGDAVCAFFGAGRLAAVVGFVALVAVYRNTRTQHAVSVASHMCHTRLDRCCTTRKHVTRKTPGVNKKVHENRARELTALFEQDNTCDFRYITTRERLFERGYTKISCAILLIALWPSDESFERQKL